MKKLIKVLTKIVAQGSEKFKVEHERMMSTETYFYDSLEQALQAANKIKAYKTIKDYEFKDDYEPEKIEIRDNDGFLVTRYEQKNGGSTFVGPNKELLKKYKSRKQQNLQDYGKKTEERLKNIPSIISKVKKLFPGSSVEVKDFKNLDMVAKFVYKNKRELQKTIQKLPSTWVRNNRVNDLRFYYKPNKLIHLSVGDTFAYLIYDFPYQVDE